MTREEVEEQLGIALSRIAQCSQQIRAARSAVKEREKLREELRCLIKAYDEVDDELAEGQEAASWIG